MRIPDLLNNQDENGVGIPIRPDDPQYLPLLSNLQGNILKGHGRDSTVHVFVRFTAEPAQVRKALAALATRYVTSALRQENERQQYKKFKIPGRIFGNILLSAHGYEALGYSAQEVVQKLPEESDPGVASNFHEGMHANHAELGDPSPDQWEAGYRGPRSIDAMILIADDDRDHLRREARHLLDEMSSFSEVVAVERGVALRTDSGEGIEHFGYVDGRSQPIYFTDDEDGSTNVWKPFEPLKSVLVEDGFAGGAESSAFGSFFVFRKLEQDVLRFKIREHLLADDIDRERLLQGLPPLVGEERERAGAQVVGRFEDGTPLALSPVSGFIPAKENDFDYSVDPDGAKCPFQAHIRKCNPRGDVQRIFGAPAEAERSRRITRRGITYGDRETHPNALQALESLPTRAIGDDTTKTVGLLFMCFQASISRQFGFMQKQWCNNAGFVRPDTGTDPVIGQKGSSVVPAQKWPLEYNAPAAGATTFDFGEFVRMKGGEFFFAPSMMFLLSPPDPLPAPPEGTVSS